MEARVRHLLQTDVLPEADESYHCYPWPVV
jgi:hypothetical protein